MIFKNPILGQAMYPLPPVFLTSYSIKKEERHSYILSYVLKKKSTTTKKKVQYDWRRVRGKIIQSCVSAS